MNQVEIDGAGFLEIPELSADVQRLYDDDVERVGFVTNLSRLWAHQPILHSGLFNLMGQAARAGSLTFRQRGILVVACASALGDAYCSLAWGKKLAGVTGAGVAGSVLRGDDAQIFAITAFVALRIAFSTVNDALGARPDHELSETAPASVRDAVTYGRLVGGDA